VSLALNPLFLLALAFAPAAGADPQAARAGAAAESGCYGAEPALVFSPLESAVLESVRARFLLLAPKHAPELSLAAREIAAKLAAGDREALERRTLRLSLVRACAFDPDASVLSVAAAPTRLVQLLEQELRHSNFTHVGVGVVQTGRFAHAVIVGTRRAAELAPFPRDLAAGAAPVLRGRLDGLAEARVVVTDPDGGTRTIAATATSGFEARISFASPGRYVVEVCSGGPRGPEVAAYLVVSAGGARLDEPARAPSEPEPADPAQVEARVVGAVNTLRGLHGLNPLQTSEQISDLARHYSAEMLERKMVAHVLPGGKSIGERLALAGVRYQRARENLAADETALAAAQSLEESPAHLANLLDPELTHVGVGLAHGAVPAGPAVYLTEILLTLAPADGLLPTSAASPEARVRQAIIRERARLRRPPLVADPLLDEIATRQARAMLRADALRQVDLWEVRLGLEEGTRSPLGRSRLSAGIPHRATGDAFVISTPEEAARSPHVGDASLHRVGIGVAIAKAAQGGSARFRIVVIYAD